MTWLYLDLPYEPQQPFYQKLAAYLETPDGHPRDPRVRFMLLPLAKALTIEPPPPGVEF
jgi:hypothetical protein